MWIDRAKVLERGREPTELPYRFPLRPHAEPKVPCLTPMAGFRGVKCQMPPEPSVCFCSDCADDWQFVECPARSGGTHKVKLYRAFGAQIPVVHAFLQRKFKYLIVSPEKGVFKGVMDMRPRVTEGIYNEFMDYEKTMANPTDVSHDLFQAMQTDRASVEAANGGMFNAVGDVINSAALGSRKVYTKAKADKANTGYAIESQLIERDATAPAAAFNFGPLSTTFAGPSALANEMTASATVDNTVPLATVVTPELPVAAAPTAGTTIEPVNEAIVATDHSVEGE